MTALVSLRRICITGPESTGKTTLALRLAEHLGTEAVPEAARLYAERVGRELTREDVEPIAREHIALADDAAMRAHGAGAGVLVLDTDLVSTMVYARHYYGFTSPWLEMETRRRLADLYLLCDVDVPWIDDGIRDRPNAGAQLWTDFAAALASLGARVAPVAGDWDERARRALVASLSP